MKREKRRREDESALYEERRVSNDLLQAAVPKFARYGYIAGMF
jgi:hypothetical protein